jgi:hypothetical protein
VLHFDPSDIAEQDQGDELQEQPRVHRCGRMDPQPFHVQSVQVVKTAFCNFFAAVRGEGFKRIHFGDGQQGKESGMFFLRRIYPLAVFVNFAAPLWRVPDDEVFFVRPSVSLLFTPRFQLFLPLGSSVGNRSLEFYPDGRRRYFYGFRFEKKFRKILSGPSQHQREKRTERQHVDVSQSHIRQRGGICLFSAD